MALNSTQYREAIKPQDAVAFVITLLGVAIVLFLEDPIIKLIGGSIAVLGLVALYVTIRQRINDQIQLRTRRTTLPPPAFKTRVTTDSTSTKRILFDDFQQTFGQADADPDPGPDPIAELQETLKAKPIGDSPLASRAAAPQPAPATAGDAAAAPAEPAPPVSASVPAMPGLPPLHDTYDDSSYDDDDSDGVMIPSGGESFRIVKQDRPSEPRSSGASQGARTGTAVAEKNTMPARQERAEPRRSVAEPVAVAQADVAPPPVAAPVAPAVQERKPDVIPVPFDEFRADTAANRKQAQLILEDLISDGEEDGRGSEPRSEFVRLVGQVLNAIARSIQARSIVFFWVNLEKGHLIPEARVTTGSHEIRVGARLPLGVDVVSQIARSGVPEVITDISAPAERELIAYYAGPADTRSFVGVPVFFRREVVGVLAADSTDESGFDEVSVATLAEYTRLISGLIRSYTEKYDLHLIARTLEAFEKMSRDFSGGAPTPAKTADMLARQLSELFDTLYVAVVLFDEDQREWRVAACSGDEALRAELKQVQPEMRGSLVGRSTRFAEEVLLEQIGAEARFAAGEPFVPGGTFLSLPLVATTKCYGTVAIEHASPAAYIPRDIDLMRDLSHYAAMAIEVFNTNRAIEAQVMLDEVTGLYNTDFLLAALDREISRARDFREKLSFALIAIDMPSSLRAEKSPELEEIIAASVAAVIQGALRPYDTVGRYGPMVFGAVLVKRSDQDAYLWAEKLRKEVASRILALGQRKSAVTISVGIAELSDLGTRDALLDGARQALEKARGGDGNAVILY